MKRSRLATLAGLAVTAVTTALLAPAVTSASAAPTLNPATSNPRGEARSAAVSWVESHRSTIKRAPADKVRQVASLPGANGTWSVAYERTHRGLEVFGGDFVVMTDADGNVLTTSVAQSRPIEVSSLTPRIGIKAVKEAAGTRLDAVERIGRPEKVIYALGRPRLAYRVPVSGEQGRIHAGEDVYVDARTGKVLDHTVTLAHGTGDGFHNGPDPLSFRTAQSGSTFTMTDPDVPGLTCGQANGQTRSVPVLSGPDDVWGQGNTSIETGCVDAMYSVQQQDAMLKNWLGRNSFKGDGTSWPIHVGLNDQNAFYCHGQLDCSGRNEVQFGKNPSGNWVSTLDVAGHEMGHGIDDYTPSGISRRGTQEFVGDVMGTLTEFYDNQPAPHDTPDYLIGEEANLVGSGEIRNMANPAAEGHPVCYTTAIDTTQVHAAAGPGDHWFWLLANGGTSRCDSTAVTGIGIQKAGKIFYNAMLLKTTASGYRAYRTWTLQAAKTLHPTSCTEFNAVKLAWDAINVPAQSGDPTCTGGEPGDVSVANPGNKSGTVGTAISSFTVSASGGTAPYTFTATGLPAGVSISSSGTVSGTPTTAGTYNVTVTARDAAGATGTTAFTFTVSGGGGPGSQLLGNPGFESGATVWTGTSGPITTNTGRPARSGSWKLWLGGNGRTTTETINQSVTIPAGATSATLSYWIRTDTAESGSTVYDRMRVQVVRGSTASTLRTFTNVGTSSTYTRHTHDLSSYAGQTVTIRFLMNEDVSLQTSFVVDDTALDVS